MNFFRLVRCLSVAWIFGLTVGALLPVFAFDAKDVKVGAAGWFQGGTIGKSSDTTEAKQLTGRGILVSGAQILLQAQPSDKLSIEAGVGVAASHLVASSPLGNGGYAPMNVSPYVAQGNFTYTFFSAERSKLFVRGGLFAYDYATDNQNLGLYLLRGTVYPGLVLSGFETKHVLPVANMLGLQVHQTWGGFEQDFLVSMETEFAPFYDFSPAYVAAYHFGSVFKLGGGVNFYHLIPNDSKVTSPEHIYYVDPLIPNDTTRISFAGTKLMANFSFDPKSIFGGSESLGPEDMKLYGEVALLGLDNDAAHKKIYGDYMNRMPMMMGFNIPAFKFLDRLGLEVEWYSAKFKDDFKGFEHTGGVITPFPTLSTDTLETNVKKDNFKWSLYGSRIIQKHIKVSLQVANDHFRPGIFNGYGDNKPAGSQAVTVSTKDWYWMGKVAYFF